MRFRPSSRRTALACVLSSCSLAGIVGSASAQSDLPPTDTPLTQNYHFNQNGVPSLLFWTQSSGYFAGSATSIEGRLAFVGTDCLTAGATAGRFQYHDLLSDYPQAVEYFNSGVYNITWTATMIGGTQDYAWARGHFFHDATTAAPVYYYDAWAPSSVVGSTWVTRLYQMPLPLGTQGVSLSVRSTNADAGAGAYSGVDLAHIQLNLRTGWDVEGATLAINTTATNLPQVGPIGACWLGDLNNVNRGGMFMNDPLLTMNWPDADLRITNKGTLLLLDGRLVVNTLRVVDGGALRWRGGTIEVGGFVVEGDIVGDPLVDGQLLDLEVNPGVGVTTAIGNAALIDGSIRVTSKSGLLYMAGIHSFAQLVVDGDASAALAGFSCTGADTPWIVNDNAQLTLNTATIGADLEVHPDARLVVEGTGAVTLGGNLALEGLLFTQLLQYGPVVNPFNMALPTPIDVAGVVSTPSGGSPIEMKIVAEAWADPYWNSARQFDLIRGDIASDASFWFVATGDSNFEALWAVRPDASFDVHVESTPKGDRVYLQYLPVGAPVIEAGDVTPSSCGQMDGAIDITVSGGGATFAWTGPNGFTASTEDISGLAPGTYAVVATNAAGEVSASYEVLTDSADTDGDGTADCNDGCPNDPLKTDPGTCGCGTPDTDADNDGTADCNDGCPNDPLKTDPGTCGCGTPDTDADNDGTADCNDGCPNDPLKTDPGTCGCGTPDTDADGDGTADCNDGCPNDPLKTNPGTCGCGTPDTDADNDGAADCIDGCPNDPLKTNPGTCGCGTPDTDADNDGTADCNDGCPNDPLKTDPGTCGCGTPDTDADNDGVADCNDACPDVAGNTPNGCPARPEDLNHDGSVNGADLAILVSDWGPCKACAGDINGDGVVDGSDLGMVLSAWDY